jgi:hypothetical protein
VYDFSQLTSIKVCVLYSKTRGEVAMTPFTLTLFAIAALTRLEILSAQGKIVCCNALRVEQVFQVGVLQLILCP